MMRTITASIKKNLREHKELTVFAVVVLIITGVLMHLYREATEGQARQQAIAEEIIRLHVVANSDSAEDQELKMKVRETIVTYLRGEMKDAVSVAEARQAIRENLPEVEKIAREKMNMEGYDYGVEATLETSYFPVKEYGDMTFPAGDYEALKVKLGRAEGKNWWCVMYPSLCFIDSAYQIVPDSSKEKLKESLTEEEYESLLDGENTTYSLKIWEWVKNFLT